MDLGNRKHNLLVQLVMCWTLIFFHAAAIRHQSRLHRTGKSVVCVGPRPIFMIVSSTMYTPNFGYNAVGWYLSMALILCIV